MGTSKNIVDLRSFYDMSLADLEPDELECAYPIQGELRDVSERYINPQFVARGGVKEIHAVYDRRAAQKVAIATMIKDVDLASTETFLREARLTAALHHPNIISVTDMGFNAEGAPFFAMDLLGGKNLNSLITGTQTSRTELLEIFAKVCDAIAYAHSRKIIHLDIKPHNIQVDSFGQVLVCDWGLAKILTEDDDVLMEPGVDPNLLNHATLSGHLKGTPGYMAPEQASTGGRKDMRTDVYALGCVLYAIFTGCTPIQGDGVDELMERTRNADFTGFTDEQEVPVSVQAIIMKCLSRRPEDRYQSVMALQKDVENYRHGFATVAENAAFGTHVKLLLGRHKTTVAAICLIGLVLTGIVVAAFMRISNEQQRALAARDDAVEARNKAQSHEAEALKAKEEAFDQKRLAELTLALLHSERSEAVTDDMLTEDYSSPRKKILRIGKQLEHETDERRRALMKNKLGRLYVVEQDLPAALETLDGRDNRLLRRECERFVDFSRDGQPFSDQQMATFLVALNEPELLRLTSAIYITHLKKTVARKVVLKERLALMSAMLNHLNAPEVDRDTEALHYDEERGILRLAEASYRNFQISGHSGEAINILSGVPFNVLDLSQIGVCHLFQLRGLRFNTLVVGRSQLPDLPRYISMMRHGNISTVVLDRTAFDAKTLQVLAENFELVDVVDWGRT